MEVLNAALDFLTGVHGDRSNKEERKGKIFERAFELAYKDMSTHTVAYITDAKENFFSNDSNRCTDNKTKTRNAIKEYVMTEIFNDTAMQKLMSTDLQTEFDEWHIKACNIFVDINCCVSGLKLKGEEKTASGHTELITNLLCHVDKNISGVFSIGQAQKLVNMMVKYLYIYYQCEGWGDLERLKQYAHVPIDSYVLKDVFGKKTYNGIPWSKIESYETYRECEKEIIKKAKRDGFELSFLWELENWPFKQDEND